MDSFLQKKKKKENRNILVRLHSIQIHDDYSKFNIEKGGISF